MIEMNSNLNLSLDNLYIMNSHFISILILKNNEFKRKIYFDSEITFVSYDVMFSLNVSKSTIEKLI